jgi:hypothetical protein
MKSLPLSFNYVTYCALSYYFIKSIITALATIDQLVVFLVSISCISRIAVYCRFQKKKKTALRL